MPTTFSEADKPTYDLLKQVMTKFYSELREAKPTFTVLMASNGEGPALKRNGYPCLAIIKVTSLADRAAGLCDVVLKIDQQRWDEMKEPARIALLDHELCHLEVKGRKDDLGRPKLGTRPHDFEIGGFAEVIDRQKANAHEAIALDGNFRKYVQGMFPWG